MDAPQPPFAAAGPDRPVAAPAPRPEAQTGLPGDVEADAGAVAAGRAARPGRLLFAVVTLAVLLGGVWLLATRTDLWARGYRQRRRAAALHQRDQARARARAAAPRFGTLRVNGAPPGAAVYLALGQTPLTAPHLDLGQHHRLLLELPGYGPRRLTVAPAGWRAAPAGAVAAPDTAAAATSVALSPGPDTVADDEDFAGTGAATGRTGTLRLDSTPPGATAWLLIGYTPTARIDDLRLGRSYQVMVHKAGRRAARIAVAGDSFRAGPLGLEREVDVTLEELPPAPRRR